MKRFLSVTLCLLMLLGLILPFSASACRSADKVVRVGRFESTYCYRDKYGRRRGIAYEYQQRIAAHTGWTYEYVEDSWPNLLQMLMDGDLDLISDVSYKEERAEHMLYPSLAMGAEDRIIPVCKIGSSDYYFTVNKNRPDLLNELNAALAAIQDEDPYFNQRMFDAYVQLTRTNAFLSSGQESWLKNHGTIRVGYREDYMPFCGTDKTAGGLTGALKNFLTHASNSLKNSQLQFEAYPYSSTDAALEAMRNGEIDCVFPVNLSSDYCETHGLLTINPIMQTEMNVLTRAADRPDISGGRELTVVINQGNINFETFIMDNIPDRKILTRADSGDCLRAVASREADCALDCDYRMNAVEPLVNRYKLVALPTGVSMGLSFAVPRGEHELYSILSKLANLSQDVDMEYALVSHIYSNQRIRFADFLQDNWLGVVAVLIVISAVIIFLLNQKLKGEKKLNEQQRQMEESLRRELEQKEQLASVTRIAYTDPLTGVKSKYAYQEAEERLNRRIAEGTVSEFSVVVFDLNNLKTINDSRGHEIGDEYIKDACKLICSGFKHSPVFRVGGDEFIAILEGEDYENQERLLERFERQAQENQERGGTVVAFGCSRFDPRTDKNTLAVSKRADVNMYKEKALLKNRAAGETPREPEPAAEELPVLQARKRILIADDMEINREMLGDLLAEDYDIEYAADGAETLELLRSRKDDIALLILDLYMPKLTGQEVLARMQVEEDLMNIPVIVLTVDQEAELECLRMGAMDFIPKPYPDVEIVKARIAKCIELSENRDLIRRTQRDSLTGLPNIYYFLRYVNRYDQYSKGIAFDALVCDVNQFSAMKKQKGPQFGDRVLRAVGGGVRKLVRKTGGISCRKERDTFLVYCPHQEDYGELLNAFLADVAGNRDLSGVTLRFGVFANAQQEPDPEERFVRAKLAADSVKEEPGKLCGFYTYSPGT